MNFWNAILLGAVQGVAEFLPISSSGHLSIMQNLLGVSYSEADNLFFTVLLHFGTLIAVCLSYWSDIRSMVTESVLYITGKGESEGGRPNSSVRMLLLVVVATLPLFIVLPFYSAVDSLFSNTLFVSVALVVTGGILWLSDRLNEGEKTSRTASILDALIVGFAQMAAVLPGLSRSGTTTVVGLCRGMRRDFAVRLSFLMSIPAVLGSFVLSLFDAFKAGVNWQLMPMYLVGTAVSMVVGFVSIQLMRRLVVKAKLSWFAYYCWAVGAVSFVASLFVK